MTTVVLSIYAFGVLCMATAMYRHVVSQPKGWTGRELAAVAILGMFTSLTWPLWMPVTTMLSYGDGWRPR